MNQFVEVKTSELIGYALDWAVGKACEERHPTLYLGENEIWRVGPFAKVWNPSDDWSQGGPLIEKYNVLLSPPTSMVHRNFGSFDSRNGWDESGYWGATIFAKVRKHRRKAFNHPASALIVAMRAVVQFELGDTVQVPGNLIGVTS